MKISRKVLHYLCRTIEALDDASLSALYVEALINEYDEWFGEMLANEIIERPEGLNALLAIEVSLYEQGMLGVCWPLHEAVLINFCKRGDLYDVIYTLAENGNLTNAIRIVAAGCDWLPEGELDDETLDALAEILKTEIDMM